MAQMESYARFRSIPMIEQGVEFTSDNYNKLKGKNMFIKWYMLRLEIIFEHIFGLAKPIFVVFEVTLVKYDKTLCKGLDILEDRFPSLFLPVQMFSSTTKEQVKTSLMKPVIQRANTIRRISQAMLDNKVTNYAVEKIENALEKADEYVDKYLPEDGQSEEKKEEPVKRKVPKPSDKLKKAVHAIKHAERLNKTLRQRIAQRALLEARALKRQTTQTINVLAFSAKLIVTDPKLAIQKGKELWVYLSENEPENQASPSTLEHLFVMLTRESARKFVHITNFIIEIIVILPKWMSRQYSNGTEQLMIFTNSLLELLHMSEHRDLVLGKLAMTIQTIENVSSSIQYYLKTFLESLALLIAGNYGEKLQAPRNHRLIDENSSINGVY